MTKARDLASAIPAPSTVSSAELGYLDGVTSAIQTQIDSKIGSASAINPTIVDAKGDIIAATAADTVARLAVGANGTVLTAASGQATGLEWATPSAGGMTLLDTLTLSGASVTSSSFSSAYKGLRIYVKNLVCNQNAGFNFRMNADTGSNYSSVFYNNGFAAEAHAATTLRIFNITNQTTVLKAANAIIDIMKPEDTDQVFLTYTAITGATGTAMEQFLGQGIYDSSAAITSVTFLSSPHTMTSGTAFIYGVN